MAIVDRPGPTEERAIAALVTAAFVQPDEPVLMHRLRAARRPTLELVARDGNALVGHVAFSALEIGVTLGDGHWWSLPPRAPWRHLAAGCCRPAPEARAPELSAP